MVSRRQHIIRWIVLTVLILGFTVLCFTVLAPWQLGKNTQTSRKNQQLVRAQQLPTVALSSLNSSLADPSNEYRSVTLIGHFLPVPTTMLRLRLVNNQPVIKILNPFMDTNGHTYLIYRGYVDINSQPKPPPLDIVTITARIRRDEKIGSEKAQPITDHGNIIVYSTSSSLAATAWHIPLVPGYLELESGSPGALATEPLPNQETGPYLSYGLQWIAFGILAPIGLGYLLYSQYVLNRQSEDINNSAGAQKPSMHPCDSSTSPEQLLPSSALSDAGVSDEYADKNQEPAPKKSRSKKEQKQQLLAQLRGNQ